MHASSVLLFDSRSTIEPSEIISPVPRRHLLQTSESLHWLQLGSYPESDLQARCASPVSVASSAASVYPSTSGASKHLSFSALQQQEFAARGILSGSLRKGLESSREDPGACRRWIRWMQKQGLKAWVVPSAIAASVWVKWCIGLGGYSGVFIEVLSFIRTSLNQLLCRLCYPANVR